MTYDIQNHNNKEKNHQIKPLKHLGQNFLVNPKIVNKILKAANLESKDIILEIGPGKGALTFDLSSKVQKVISVEKDPRLVSYLRNNIDSLKIKNMEVIQEDFLNFDLSQLPPSYKVVGSLPFNISKKIIKKLLQSSASPDSMVLVLQKEVAENYTSQVPNSSFLSNFVKIYGTCKYLFTVKKGNFRPMPKVDAGVVKFVAAEQPKLHKEMSNFFKMIFNKPRKTIKNNLKSLPFSDMQHSSSFFKKADKTVDLNKRPQEIKFSTMQQLFMLYNSM
jgi:16S rRNA (adenine1518-N6/adenine1519-N6)-dimethyltransferase